MTIEGRPTLSQETYKKYSLEHLETWIHDAMNLDDVSAQEIYDVIIGAITEDIDYHSTQLDRRQKLLSLLGGSSSTLTEFKSEDYWSSMYPDIPEDTVEPVITEATPKDWKDFWYSPEEHGTWGANGFEGVWKEMDSVEPLTPVTKEQSREYNLREAEYYNKRAELDAEHDRKNQCTCDY